MENLNICTVYKGDSFLHSIRSLFTLCIHLFTTEPKTQPNYFRLHSPSIFVMEYNSKMVDLMSILFFWHLTNNSITLYLGLFYSVYCIAHCWEESTTSSKKFQFYIIELLDVSKLCCWARTSCSSQFGTRQSLVIDLQILFSHTHTNLCLITKEC